MVIQCLSFLCELLLIPRRISTAEVIVDSRGGNPNKDATRYFTESLSPRRDGR